MMKIHVTELREGDACPCQMHECEVSLDVGDYTDLSFEKDKYGVWLRAYGEGEAEWHPRYCPLCGRKLRG